MSASPQGPENRLARETSPYLLQHARNPVDWYPWGPEALARSKAEDKPIFLSVGYSACHWCHVMERECFEDAGIARLMNELFVNVKVDREERPDVDEIYMKAVQAMTGSGGWPMSVFLTPDLEPFYGGTYFPPRGLYGRPGFPQVLAGLAKAWKEDRANLAKRAKTLASHIADEGRAKATGEIDPAVLEASRIALVGQFDPRWGGFGDAPKFPHALDLRILLRHAQRTGDAAARQAAILSLQRMAEGGIHDQLGGGFHRYSVDERWLVPHFEKMLYDNALLVPAYLEASLVTGDARHAEVARRACDWALREMRTPQGGFASSQDADSEGEEGKFFVWTLRGLEDVLGKKLGAQAAAWFGVTAEGNFEHGNSILWRHEPAERVAQELRTSLPELEAAMRGASARLLAERERRVKPGTDDKVLASWNGLFVSALAQAHQVLEEPRYLEAARGAANWILTGMRQPDGRLFATSRHGRAHLNAYLDDYAFTIQGLLDLYECDFDPRWIREALALDEVLRDRFEDDEGGYFTTARDHEQLIARLKAPHDGALPSGNGVQALNLLRLAELTGRRELAQRAERTIRSMAGLVNRFPQAFSALLLAVDWLAVGPREVVVAGDPRNPGVREMLRAVRSTFAPQRVVALAGPGADLDLVPLLRDKPPGANGARAYVCRNWACQAPLDDAAALRAELAAPIPVA
ncbi:MAG: thioredoxin domain-containing protein [Planctomycetota bacterium]|nr:thioredoxin domain-containing protein [Planctomycetota bacterium]